MQHEVLLVIYATPSANGDHDSTIPVLALPYPQILDAGVFLSGLFSDIPRQYSGACTLCHA